MTFSDIVVFVLINIKVLNTHLSDMTGISFKRAGRRMVEGTTTDFNAVDEHFIRMIIFVLTDHSVSCRPV